MQRIQLYELGNWNAAVLIPASQAAIVGGLIGAAVGAGAVLGELPNPGTLGTLAGCAGAFVTFNSGLMAFRRAVTPPMTPPPAPAQLIPARKMTQEVLRVELKHDKSRTQLLELPATAEQLTALGRGVLGGASLAENTWTGSGGQFTRAEFGRLRNELIRRGLAGWNSPGTPARGWTLTPAGRAAFRYFATLNPGG